MSAERHSNEIRPQTTEEMSAERQHNHQILPPPEIRTREWIRQSDHHLGNEPYTILLEETHQITADIELEIRVIRWKIPPTKKCA